MHKKYGPVVRVNPYELHFETPEFDEEIYSGGNRKRDKWYYQARRLGLTNALIGTMDHDIHKMRRTSLNAYFSKTKVRQLQPVIDEKIHILLERLKKERDTGVVLNMRHAFTAYANG